MCFFSKYSNIVENNNSQHYEIGPYKVKIHKCKVTNLECDIEVFHELLLNYFHPKDKIIKANV